MQHYRLLEKVPVYSAADATSPILDELQPGDLVMLGETRTSETNKWDTVTLSDGRTGYLSSKTKGHTVSSNWKYRLDEMATVYSAPSITSRVESKIQNGDQVTVEASITFAGEKWHAVVLSNGKGGYISGETKGRRIDDKIGPPKRPVGVTIVSWILIVLFGLLGLVQQFIMISLPEYESAIAKDSIPDWFQMIFPFVSSIAMLLLGACMLQGANWARWVFVAWGSVAVVIAPFTLGFNPIAIPGIVIYAILAIVLFQKKSTDFFKPQNVIQAA